MKAVIGGTGLTRMPGVRLMREHSLMTDLGKASSAISECDCDGQSVLFLARHGDPHRIAPHRINYRANLLALQAAGATQILAINAVGGIDPDLKPGQLVLPDQIIDYTHTRESSFFDGEYRPLDHLDMSLPYHPALRDQIAMAVQACDEGLVKQAVYGATQGPRLETPAEITRMAQDGCTIVGMTGMPEAALAAELSLPYACLALVVNPAAGVQSEPISLAQMQAVIDERMQVVMQIIRHWVAATD